MTRLFERRGHFVIMARKGAHDFDGKCEMCGTFDELRPYGPGRKNVCFDCGMKDEETALKNFKQMLDEA